MIELLRKTPISILLLLAVITIGSAAAVATLTVTTTTTTAIFAAEDLQVDSSAMIENTSVLKVSASSTGTGQTQGAAVEATAGFAIVNSTLDAANFIYQFEVKETSASGWGSTRVYQIELFADGVMLDSLFIKNASADDGNVEGVTAQFDFGSATILPSGITIKVTKVID